MSTLSLKRQIYRFLDKKTSCNLRTIEGYRQSPNHREARQVKPAEFTGGITPGIAVGVVGSSMHPVDELAL